MNKRPLCFVFLAFLVVIAVLMKWMPLSDETYDTLSGRWLLAGGKVVSIETSNANYLLTLEQVMFYQNTNSSNLDSFQKSKILQEIQQAKSKTKILCYLDEKPSMRMGSYVLIDGQVNAWSHAVNPGEFDMSDYYHTLGYQTSMKKVKFICTSQNYSKLGQLRYQIKENAAAVLELILSEQDASVIKAMVLGDKGTLNPEIKKLYQKSGIAHILAISGLHISLIGLGLYKLLRKAGGGIWPAAMICIIIMIQYGLITGMSTSTFRAVFMFVLYLVAQMIGRTYDLLTALSMAAATIVMENPRYLFYSGFQLSFGAVLGIAVVMPSMKEILNISKKSEIWIKAAQALLPGFSIFIITIPMLLHSFYEFPVYSFFLNLCIIPLMGVLVFLTLTGMGIGVFNKLIGTIITMPCHYILLFYETACKCTMTLPGSIWIIGKPSILQIGVYYEIILIGYIWNKWLRKHGRRVAASHYGMLLTLGLLILTMRIHPYSRIVMLDVGQGDGIFIQTKSGQEILIDGGSSSNAKLGTYQLIPFLKSQGVADLEAAVMTHSDSDHVSGMMELLENSDSGGILVKKLILPQIIMPDNNYCKIRETAQLHQVPVYYIQRGDTFYVNEISFECVHPESGYLYEDANQYSTTLLMECGNFRALLTGDLEGAAETQVVSYLQQNHLIDGGITMLKVGHHGSRNGTGEALLQLLNPQIALISCGENNSYGHPHKEVLERLDTRKTKVYITKKSGAVTVLIRKNNALVQEFCDKVTVD